MIFKIIISVACWLVLLVWQGAGVISVFGIKLFPIVGIVSSTLYCLFPKTFSMGLSGWKRANMLDKMIPVVIVLFCLFLSRNMKDTVIVVCIRSFYFGAIFPYLGKVFFIKES